MPPQTCYCGHCRKCDIRAATRRYHASRRPNYKSDWLISVEEEASKLIPSQSSLSLINEAVEAAVASSRALRAKAMAAAVSAWEPEEDDLLQ